MARPRRIVLAEEARSAPAPSPRRYPWSPSRRQRRRLPAAAPRPRRASRAPSATATATNRCSTSCCSTNGSTTTCGRTTSSHRRTAPSAACSSSSSPRRARSDDEPTTSWLRPSLHCCALRRHASRRHASRHRASPHPSWHRYASRRNACRRCSRALRRHATTSLVLPCVSILVRVVTGGTAIFAHKLKCWSASPRGSRLPPCINQRRVGERSGIGKLRRDLEPAKFSAVGKEQQVESPLARVARCANARHLVAPDDAP
jgi:hypothetical protein